MAQFIDRILGMHLSDRTKELKKGFTFEAEGDFRLTKILLESDSVLDRIEAIKKRNNNYALLDDLIHGMVLGKIKISGSLDNDKILETYRLSDHVIDKNVRFFYRNLKGIWYFDKL
jgi:hypothetical protein